MDLIAQVAIAAGLAWGSGIRLYAVVFACGVMGRLGWIALPGDLTVLSHDWVLWCSGVMLVAEFVADKIPAFDSVWDALHTFIRIPAGALLAWGTLAEHGPAAQFAAALVAGSITTGTHLAKAGTRAAINHSPEPFSNWIASFGEDGAVLAGLWLAIAYPMLFLVLLALFLLLLVWLLPRLWRLVRSVLGRVFGRPRSGAAAA